MFLAQAQSMHIENKAQKEYLQRTQERANRLDVESEEAKQSRAPIRKRDREYRDACHESEHADRMKKLQEQSVHDEKVRSCTIERKNQNMLISLKDSVKEMETNLEYERNRQRQESSDVEFENQEQTLSYSRQLELLQIRYEYAMTKVRQAQKEHQADILFEQEQRAIANDRKIDMLKADLERAQVRLQLGEMYGAALPDRLFE